MSYDRKPLLAFSEDQERANLIDSDFDFSMPARKRRSKAFRRRKRSGRVTRRRRRRVGRKRAIKGGHRVTKGRISIRVKGYGLQKFPAGQLARFVPISKLRTAARKLLAKSGVRKSSGGRRRKSGGRKRGSKKGRRSRKGGRKAKATSFGFF